MLFDVASFIVLFDPVQFFVDIDLIDLRSSDFVATAPVNYGFEPETGSPDWELLSFEVLLIGQVVNEFPLLHERSRFIIHN